MKEEREERKREIDEYRGAEQTARQKQRDTDAKQMDEVRVAFEALNCVPKDDSERLDHFAERWHGEFDLFSTNHVDHCFDVDYYPRRYVEFYWVGQDGKREDGPPTQGQRRRGEDHVYLDANTGCALAPFRAPKRASRKRLQLGVYEPHDDVLIRFIGKEYLMMRMRSKDIVPKGKQTPSVPKYFRFASWEYAKTNRR